MTGTLQYPVTGPTTTITFDGIRKITRERAITKIFEKGDLDGGAVIESAGTSLLKIKVAFEFLSDATTAAIEKWDEFDTLLKDSNESSMRFSITYETEIGNKTQYYDGKVTGLTCEDIEGDPDTIIGTFGFTVETKGVVS